MADVTWQLLELLGESLVVALLGWVGIRLALRSVAGHPFVGVAAALQFLLVWAVAIVAQYSLRWETWTLVRAAYGLLFVLGVVAWKVGPAKRASTRRRRRKSPAGAPGTKSPARRRRVR